MGPIMASIVTDKSGKKPSRAIQFSFNGKRHTVRLGAVNLRSCTPAKLAIEDLLHCRITGETPRTSTSEWLASLPTKIRRRLARTGLVEQVDEGNVGACPTLGDFLDAYIEMRPDVKNSTEATYKRAKKHLVDHFGSNKHLGSISPGDADGFAAYLRGDARLSENTSRRTIALARQFFSAAIRHGHVEHNPFEGIPTALRSNTDRLRFVSVEDIEKAIAECPDVEWKLIFALARYGGLRCPSEVLQLRWVDVNWDKSRFTVRATKTEHHADAGVRQVPIFPELLPYLREAFEQASEGSEFVITKYRPGCNLNPHARRIVQRAGLTPWPKIFQNLRSSRETELAEKYPLHAVTAWLGNTPTIAQAHYLQSREVYFEMAAAGENSLQIPKQKVAETGGSGANEEVTTNENDEEFPEIPGVSSSFCSNEKEKVGRGGLEPPTPAFSVPCSTN
jgi:integrase